MKYHYKWSWIVQVQRLSRLSPMLPKKKKIKNKIGDYLSVEEPLTHNQENFSQICISFWNFLRHFHAIPDRPVYLLDSDWRGGVCDCAQFTNHGLLTVAWAARGRRVKGQVLSFIFSQSYRLQNQNRIIFPSIFKHSHYII